MFSQASIFSCEMITSISHIAFSSLSEIFVTPSDFFNNGGFRKKNVLISDSIERRFDDSMSSFSNSCSSSEFRDFFQTKMNSRMRSRELECPFLH